MFEFQLKMQNCTGSKFMLKKNTVLRKMTKQNIDTGLNLEW